ncbi:hypothetical protein [melian virus]|uniref:Uncharacterized protein n=1 Tax=melian virus TaxID=2940995 RepID=A0AAE9KYX2_9MONO|nr:hypothetical protein [melian virus]
MSFDVYEVPDSCSRSFRTTSSRRSRYIRKDYKCTIIIVLVVILAVTITSSYFVIWLVSSNSKAGYNTEAYQRNNNFENRVQSITTVRTRSSSKHPFRPGIPGRNNCPRRTVPSYP